MELNHELKSKRKIIESGGITYKSNEQLILNHSDNISDLSVISHNEVTVSETGITDSSSFSSLSDNKASPISKLRILPVTELKNHQPLIIFETNLDIIESETDTKKKIISSILNILRSHAAETVYSTKNKSIEYFYTLFQDCISSFIIEGFESLVVDSLTDILLPTSDFLSDVGLERDFENLKIIQSILYYYLVGMTPNNISFEKTFLTLDSGDRETSFLLPISKAISEVDFAWLTKQSYPELIREFNNLNGGSKLERVKDSISIFTQEQIPNLIIKIINSLKNNYLFAEHKNIIQESCVSNLYANNQLKGDIDQAPFIIGRLLEICLSKSQKEFTSIFLQLDGPLVIMPFMYYSSIQDFFLRFFGFIGINYHRECKYSEYSSSLLDFEYPESAQESSIGEFDQDKLFFQEQYLNVGISPIIYEWIIESDFIQRFLFPLLNIINCGQEDVNEEPMFGKIDLIDSALGVIEVIFRLVEYLKPENTGLPLNMTSIGLKWFIFVSEINNPSNSYQQNEIINNDLHLSSVKEYKIFNSEEKLVKLEYNVVETLQLNNSNEKTSKQDIDKYKDIEYENSGKNFNSDILYDNQTSFLGKDNISYSGTKIEEYFALVTGEGKTIKNLSVYQSLERSMRFLNNFIAESSILNLVCEIIIHNPKHTVNENLYNLKLRSLNVLEEIINLAFSTNINIIGCFKTRIIDKVKPYLSKFCKFMILKYETNTNNGETCYLVSLLTVIKIILLYDESHELINNLDSDFWVWLLDLFIKKRENSHTSVHCKTIFELGLRFGSCSTLEILFNNVKLVDRLSKFIYDGTDLDGCCIEEKESSNKRTGKKRRILGSVNNLFMVLGRYHDDLLKAVLNSNFSEIVKEIIKRMVFSQFNKYGKSVNNTMEIVSLIIEHEFGMVQLLQDGEKCELANSLGIDKQKIVSLLANMSCSTKFHKFVKTYRITNETVSAQNSFLRAEDLDSRYAKNMENSSQSPNSVHKKYLDLEESPNFQEIGIYGTQLLSKILRTYFSGNIIDLFKCDENCECSKWSFCNVFRNLIIEKNHSNGISVFPILPLEESKKIRETRKRQMKLYSSIQKSD